MFHHIKIILEVLKNFGYNKMKYLSVAQKERLDDLYSNITVKDGKLVGSKSFISMVDKLEKKGLNVLKYRHYTHICAIQSS